MKRSFPPRNSKLQGTEAPISHHPASKDNEVTTEEMEAHTHTKLLTVATHSPAQVSCLLTFSPTLELHPNRFIDVFGEI